MELQYLIFFKKTLALTIKTKPHQPIALHWVSKHDRIVLNRIEDFINKSFGILFYWTEYQNEVVFIFIKIISEYSVWYLVY